MNSQPTYRLRNKADDQCSEALERMKTQLVSRRSIRELFIVPNSYAEEPDEIDLYGHSHVLCSFSYDVVSPQSREYKLILRALLGDHVQIVIEFRSSKAIANIYPTLQKTSPLANFDSEVARLLTELFASEV